ncbi:tripartite tricarboxylate transporter permease [Clostridium grantii]|uniref:Putative tricarboxylic transport membrane protein n=1 Tax=Clostridium grantii DSM 8605 TaxID=1121316 RepID=A0A1M5UB08_9CLOT|nr:tripartite tricarboxylate transporter permease [Clostridium grantii]SHH59873.1 putative tricarboxylic transport membrane protein [Clostridium grantii DSM 8605]
MLTELGTFFTQILHVFSDPLLVIVLFGATALGLIMGALPGLTATMGIALLTGLTYNVPLQYTFAILMGIYVGGIYGGSISAILLNIPGTASAAATALDGHKLALEGKAERTIKITRLASIIGTFLGVVALTMIAPVMAKLALNFTSPEFFMLAFFGVMICGSVVSEDLTIKGWIAGILGLLLAFVRYDDVEGISKFTFGISELQSGIQVIPAMIGFYAVPEVIKAFVRNETFSVVENSESDKSFLGVLFGKIFNLFRSEKKEVATFKDVLEEEKFIFKTVFSQLRAIIQSAAIGLGLGALPGVGEDVAAWVSYDTARKTSKNGDKFGTGIYEGTIAPEVGNNAAIGGAIIPLLTLGIPGSPPAAVLLGALMLHNVRPGPRIQIENPGFIAMIAALLFCAIIALWIVGSILAKPMTKVLKVPTVYLMPIIAILSVVGGYSLSMSSFDLITIFIFGIIGYIFDKMQYSAAPIILGLILGNMLDFRFRQALITNNGSFLIFVTRPISLIFLVIIIFTIAKIIIKGIKESKQENIAG